MQKVENYEKIIIKKNKNMTKIPKPFTFLTIIALLLQLSGPWGFIAIAEANGGFAWPSFWQDYLTADGQIVNDYEKTSTVGTYDPSHGHAAVPPEETDIASGVDKTGANPGEYPSLQYYYDNSETSECDDDYLFLRMRLVGDPRGGGGLAQ